MEKWEANVINKCDYVITFSKASAEVIQKYYQKEPDKIIVMPIPAYIPEPLLPSKNIIKKEFGEELHLLLVGKRFNLRGMDIAIEVTRELNRKGVPTELRIVGINGEDQEHIRFMGNYDKENPQELAAYFNFFHWADLLIHPSRFHSAGIVISEAAGFGLPTITNAAGGLATSVLHDQTGIVLPEGSPSSAYVDAITTLLQDKPRYHRYQLAARDRFDQILDWDKAGQQLFDIIKNAVE
jgi:glycosyltransferase involved in cell wall biosynthesis